MRIDVLGVGFDNVTMGEAVKRALELIRQRRGGCVVTPNPEIVWMARKDSRLREIINKADLVLADGIGILYGAGILGTPLRQRVPGIDFAAALVGELAREGRSLFLLGSGPGVAEQAAGKLQADFPGLVIAGTNDGYFTDDEAVVEKINGARPDLLMVCLGAPKQELWMGENAPRLNVGLMAGFGGALDVFSGQVSRAPEGWRKLGLEWLYRMIKEPRRAKRAAALPLFLAAVCGHRLGGKNDAR